jgi:type I restriction enzyme, R subunit
MPSKEAKSRIKINRLLEEAGWRMLDDKNGKANVLLENHVKITRKDFDKWGDDFEHTSSGSIDYLLIDEKGFPLIVLEAKRENIEPLSAKNQAKKYAKSISCRFVILSNGNSHYLWDIEKGNPERIIKFPTPESIAGYKAFSPNRDRLWLEPVGEDYIAKTQYPNYANDPEFLNPVTRSRFFERTKVRFLRKYQKEAVLAIQKNAREGKNRFLFEMATGTGKTLTAAAVIKLFLRSGNARRILFLVDRLELEDQAHKAFVNYLKNDYSAVIYKENREDWRRAEIVITTVQSLLFNNKFRDLFSPTDFDLVISDEAHRSIGGNSRAVFEYFIGFKLGLTATPKDYLKKFEKSSAADPREQERRMLLDTYKTFGCDSGEPTYRYSLLDGVKDDFLVNPVVVDARTDVTTQLLSDDGYAAIIISDDGSEDETSYHKSDFEKKFYSEKTNRLFCQTFLANALHDPISGEIGKTIIFTVSQKHATKITQILNEIADVLYPGKYNSDFAEQVTSIVPDAQQMTINFANNNLNGYANYLDFYRTSKTRVCVTVGMMTTGYDCTDILNLCLMRPIFSTTDFIQIKGRGTRKHNFSEQVIDIKEKENYNKEEKKTFKMFDFFANCEYFEEEFNYDEVLKLPALRGDSPTGGGGGVVYTGEFETFDPDILKTLEEKKIDAKGMKIDRMFFNHFEEVVKKDQVIQDGVVDERWDFVMNYIIQNIMDKPNEYFTLEKLRKSIQADRRVSLREMVEKIYGLIPHIKSKEELLEEEFQKFIADRKPTDDDNLQAMKFFFMAYISNNKVREIIDKRNYAELNVTSAFPMSAFKEVSKKWRSEIPEYIKDYVTLNKFLE